MKIIYKNKTTLIFFVTVICSGILSSFFYQKMYVEAENFKSSITLYKKNKFPKTALLQSDKNLTLSEVIKKGKKLIIYLDTACSACKEEAEFLGEASELKKIGVDIILTGPDSIEDFNKFKESYNFELPFFSDSSSEFRNKLKVTGTPTHFYIVNGNLEGSWMGIKPGSGIELLQSKIQYIEKKQNKGV